MLKKENSITIFILDASKSMKKLDKKEYRDLLRRRAYKLLFDYFGISGDNLKQNNFGKKYIASPVSNKYFNISYSSQVAVLAVSDEEIGIDVECLNKTVSSKSRSILGLDYGKGDIEFYYKWTCIEALTKFYGIGLVNGFRDIQVPERLNLEQYEIVNDEGKQHYFYSRIVEDYLITICQSSPKQLSFVLKEILH